ncbi:MAG: hypothetical protein RLZZ225_855 [Pseudomonadota bacterium]
MPLLRKGLISFSMLLASFCFLSACGHKNPLVNEQTIHFMKENFFLRGEDFPIVECTDYYSGNKPSTALKKKCKEWTQEYYHLLMNMHSIPATTTLEDFRDAAFWKQVKIAKVW